MGSSADIGATRPAAPPGPAGTPPEAAGTCAPRRRPTGAAPSVRPGAGPAADASASALAPPARRTRRAPARRTAAADGGALPGLPCDLLPDILGRLDMRSLGRLACVSRGLRAAAAAPELWRRRLEDMAVPDEPADPAEVRTACLAWTAMRRARPTCEATQVWQGDISFTAMGARTFAAATTAHEVRLFDVDGTPTVTLPAMQAQVRDLCVIDDAVVVGYDDGHVRTWNAAGDLIQTLRDPHANKVYRLAGDRDVIAALVTYGRALCVWSRPESALLYRTDFARTRAFGINIVDATTLALVVQPTAVEFWRCDRPEKVASVPLPAEMHVSCRLRVGRTRILPGRLPSPPRNTLHTLWHGHLTGTRARSEAVRLPEFTSEVFLVDDVALVTKSLTALAVSDARTGAYLYEWQPHGQQYFWICGIFRDRIVTRGVGSSGWTYKF